MCRWNFCWKFKSNLGPLLERCAPSSSTARTRSTDLGPEAKMAKETSPAVGSVLPSPLSMTTPKPWLLRGIFGGHADFLCVGFFQACQRSPTLKSWSVDFKTLIGNLNYLTFDQILDDFVKLEQILQGFNLLSFFL